MYSESNKIQASKSFVVLGRSGRSLPLPIRPDENENKLVERCRTGDIQAFELLYRAHAGEAVRTAFFVTRDWAAAEDAAQEAFTRAFRSMRKLLPGWPFAPWLHRIVVNEARRVARRASRVGIPVALVWDEPPASSLPGPGGAGAGRAPEGAIGEGAARKDAAEGDAGLSAEEVALQAERRASLWKAVLDLPEPYRLPIILKYHRDLSEVEIGAILGIPVGRVKSRLYDARQRLKKALGNWMAEE